MAQVYIDSKFLLKRGTAARWAEVNPVLERGEPGFIVDEGRLKIGDGETPFNNLPYIGEGIDPDDYISKDELDEAISGIEIPDVSNFVTETYVQEAIDAIEIPEMKEIIALTQEEVLDICK